MLGMLSPSFMRWRLHKNHTNRSHIFLKLHHHHHLDKQGGAEFNSAPARRLSAAFGLDLAPTTAGNKQVFVIGSPHGDSLGFEGNMEHCNERGNFNVRIQNSGKKICWCQLRENWFILISTFCRHFFRRSGRLLQPTANTREAQIQCSRPLFRRDSSKILGSFLHHLHLSAGLK